MSKQKFNFAQFFMIWAEMQRWCVPEVHLRVICYLEDDTWVQDSKVLMLWRSLGKSTIVDLWVAYKLAVDPSLRFLIMSADKDTARNSSQDILSIIRQHPLCKHLITNQNETRQDRFFVNGHTDSRNASVVAYGILSNVTGRRADIIIYDDVEVQKNCGTDFKRKALRRRLAETANLLIPGGLRLFVGTYHDYESIYDDQIQLGSSLLKIPLIKKPEGEFPYITGKSEWDERFGADYIETKQRTQAKAEFLSQYLLEAVPIEDSTFDPVMINRYDEEIEFFTANRVHSAKLGETLLLSCTAWWDPALAGIKNDDSVLAIVFTDAQSNIYIHRTIEVQGDADAQCEQVKRHALQFHIPVINIETNGIGNFLPDILLKHLNGTGIGVNGQYTTERKNDKIVTQFETPLYGGFLYAHHSVMDGKFPLQMRDFDFNETRNQDDYIDSVASAIKNEPVRIAAFTPSGQTIVAPWMGHDSVELERDYFSFD